MIRPIPTILLFVLNVFFGVLPILAQNNHDLRLELTASIVQLRNYGRDDDADRQLVIRSFVINQTQHDITIARGSLERIQLDAGLSTYVFVFVPKYDDNGRMLIPSASDYFPVSLKPDEKTELATITISYRRQEKIAANFSAQYFVDAPLGKRLGLWYGRLLARIPVSGEITTSKPKQ